MFKQIPSLIICALMVLFAADAAAQNIIISEFMADNLTSADVDEDGNHSDWLELQNNGPTEVDLNGWYLTDKAGDLRQWQFPAVTPDVKLAPGGRLVVWCSGEDRKASVTKLHTNFKLDKDGEFLALVRPDGVTIEHSYGPTYPPQIVNGTYGVAPLLETNVVVPEGAAGKAHVPTDANDYTVTMAGWNSSPTFNDSTWQAGNSGFGFGSPFTGLLGAGGDVGVAMHGINASCCVRFLFDLPAGTVTQAVRLKVKYDDGFVCFLNGTRIGGSFASNPLTWNSATLVNLNRPDASASTFETTTPSNAVGALVPGSNVLAFQMLNSNTTEADPANALLRPQLEVDVVVGTTTGYLSSSTRGAANSAVTTAIGPAIDQVTKNPARPVGGAASAPITVTAKVTPTLRPLAPTNPVVLKWRRMYGAETTVNMTFDATSGLYTADVPTTSLAAGEMIRWRIEAKDNGASPTYSYAPPYPFSATTPPTNPPPTSLTVDLDQYYGTVALDNITTTNLPILHWFANNPANADGTTGESCSFLFQPIPKFPPGTPDYTPPGPQFYDNIPVNRHGQSSGGFPQKSHNLSFNKENRFFLKDGNPEIRGVNLLTTYADKTKIRHTLAYDTWAKSGHLASEFCIPVHVRQNGTFKGLYDFVEDANEDFLERFDLDPFGSLYKVYNSLENANVAVNNGGGSEKKNPDTSDFTDLQAFVTGIGDAQGTVNRLRYTYDNVDIPSLVNFLAVHTLIMNRDFGHKNYYVFRDTRDTGEWSVLPWDQDLSFGHTWTSAQNYFDDDIHSQGPLQLGGGNKLNRILYESPELNAMFVARLRALANQFYVSTSETNGPFEQKINELINAIDPNPNNPSSGTDDADENARKWGFWVDGSGTQLAHTDARMADHTVRAQTNRILTANPNPPYPSASPYANWGDGSTSVPAFLPGRRAFFFNPTPPNSGTMPLPPTPPTNNPPLTIDVIDFNPAAGTQDQEYFIITNPNNFAVDLSGWKVSGEVEMTFRGGTVIPRQGATTLQGSNASYVNKLIVANKPLGFRQRTASPKANEFRYVTGPYKGQLSARGGAIILSRPNNPLDPSAGYTEVVNQAYAAAPTAAQQFLRITELQYAPAAPTPAEDAALPGVSASDFEFIEVTNTGSTVLNLQNARFDRGVEFVFPSGTVSTLNAGDRRLIVANLAAFRVRYGNIYDGIILGEYLGNLSNTGEELQLLDPAGEVVLEFDYLPTWHPTTLLTGRSLEALTTVHTQFGTAAAWRPSLALGGSPGALSPVIDTHPVGGTLNPGQPLNLTVAVTGSPAPTFQWRKDFVPIPDATAATYNVPGVTEANQGSYDVVVTNEGGALVSAATNVFVNDPVLITKQPLPQTVNPGTAVTLSVEAEGTAPITYQWRKGGEPIAGATGTTLDLAGNEAEQGEYDVVVTNVVGPVASNVAGVIVNDPVNITDHPDPQTVNAGASVTFTVIAEGTGPLTYQWYKNQAPIAGATNASLQIAGAVEDDEGNYHVTVGNMVNSQTSNVGSLSVLSLPVITEQPVSLAVNLGGSAEFIVSATGLGPLTYQWKKDGQPIPSATTATYQIQALIEGQLGTYEVDVTNPDGTVTSTPAQLTLVNWPEVAGTYQGLFHGPDPADPAADPLPGRITAKLTTKGKLTGSLDYFGLKNAFAAKLDVNLRAILTLNRKNTTPVTLTIYLNGTSKTLEVLASHQATAGIYTSESVAPHIPVRPKTAPAAKMGRYTLLLEPGAGAPGNLTAPGYVTLNVAKTGATSWVGKLPDSTVVRGTALLTPDDELAFYSRLYVPKMPYAGHLAGPLAIGDGTIAGEMAWRKPLQAKGLFWPNGFSMLLTASGQRYVAPLRGVRVIPLETLRIELAGPISNDTFGREVQLTLQNKFLFLEPNAEKLKLTYNRTTGGVTGSYFDIPLQKTMKLQGVIMQSDQRVSGFFLGVDTAGTWDVIVPE